MDTNHSDKIPEPEDENDDEESQEEAETVAIDKWFVDLDYDINLDGSLDVMLRDLIAGSRVDRFDFL
uniref:Uncharacterized protein n=1 Tax=viral metagenome TaxID=1070528 RepID=A0A6H1ZUU3_9ZZZZ